MTIEEQVLNDLAELDKKKKEEAKQVEKNQKRDEVDLALEAYSAKLEACLLDSTLLDEAIELKEILNQKTQEFMSLL